MNRPRLPEEKLEAAPMLEITRDSILRVRSTGTAAVLETDVGSNLNFAVGAGPGNNLVSTFSADQGTLGSSASLPFTVYAVLPTGPTAGGANDAASANNIILVRFNNLTLP